MSTATGPVDHSFDGSFSGAHDSLDDFVADGQAMHVRAVLDLPGAAGPVTGSAPPVVDVPDGTAAIVADITAYGG